MKCTEVEKLLPLYAGNDLADDGRAHALSEHLNACARCSRTMEEFRTSREIFQNQPAPEFDEPFYQSIRAGVLRDIRNHPAPRPSLLESLRLALMHRPAVAATLALLIIFAALSVVVRRSLTVHNKHLASVENGFGEINPDELNEGADVSKRKDVSPPRLPEMARLPRQNASLPRAPRKKQAVEENGASQGNLETVVRNAPAPAVTPDAPQNDGAPLSDAQPAQAIARMEIQTSDPNIRIIWLGRKPSE